jgi:hypothetical protein
MEKGEAAMGFEMVSALLVALASSVPASAGHTWRTYDNVRYAYQICYPSDLLKPQPESTNGDGRRFTGAKEAVLSVYASYPGHTLANDEAQMVKFLSEDGGTIAYKTQRPTWYVVSAQQGNRITYHRAAKAGDLVASFDLHYPATQKRLWDPIAGKIGTCLRMLDAPHPAKRGVTR